MSNSKIASNSDLVNKRKLSGDHFGEKSLSINTALTPSEKSERRKKRKNRRDRDGSRGDRNRGRGRNDAGRDDKSKPKKKRRTGDFVQVQVNIGRRHKVNPNRLMGLVNERIGGKKPDFGEISIQATSTNFEVEARSVPAVIAALTGATFEGRAVKARTV